MTTAGVAGLLVVGWLVVAASTGLSVLVFATGSMAPEMPTGTAALVQVVPASEVEVGDVVTVARPDGLPVTHRVVEIAPVAGDPERRSLTLRGDANDTPDSTPYVVAEVKRVIASQPGLGHVLERLRTPPAMLGLTVIVAAITGWGFWPTRDESTSEDEA